MAMAIRNSLQRLLGITVKNDFQLSNNDRLDRKLSKEFSQPSFLSDCKQKNIM